MGSVLLMRCLAVPCLCKWQGTPCSASHDSISITSASLKFFQGDKEKSYTTASTILSCRPIMVKMNRSHPFVSSLYPCWDPAKKTFDKADQQFSPSKGQDFVCLFVCFKAVHSRNKAASELCQNAASQFDVKRGCQLDRKQKEALIFGSTEP